MDKSEGTIAIGAEPVDVKADTSRGTHDVKSPPWWKIGGKDYSYVSIDGDYTVASGESSSTESFADDLVKRRNSVFQAPEAVELYKPSESYEGAHRFDPALVWTQDEEKALVRRVSIIPAIINARISNFGHSLIGRSLYQLASCSSPYNSIVEISPRHCPITC